MLYVYILKNKDNTFYVGQTYNLARRVNDRSVRQGAKFTKDTKDLQLVYSEEYTSRAEAMKREKQLKKWSKSKRLALIAGDIEKLVLLSKESDQSIRGE